MSTEVQPVHYPSMRGHRFHLLDGLRGIAAILILLHHTLPPWRPHLPLHEAWLAVDFFFLLSGFVISFAYEARFDSGMRLRDFAVARLIRLYPLYLLGTLLGILSLALVGSLSAHVRLSLTDVALSLPSALLLIPNILNHWRKQYCFPFDIPAWSLFFELVANFLFALLLRRRLGKSPVILLLVVASFITLLVAARRGLPSLDVGSSLTTMLLGLPRVGFSFFTGCLLFRLYRSRIQTMRSAWHTCVFPLVSSIGIVAVLLASSAVTNTIAYQLFVVAVLFPALLFLGAHSQLSAPINRLCAFLGDISYPLYILHAAFIFPLNGSKPLHLVQLHPSAAPWVLLLVIASLLAFAWFVAHHPDRSIRLWLTHRYNTSTA